MSQKFEHCGKSPLIEVIQMKVQKIQFAPIVNSIQMKLREKRYRDQSTSH
jgi:hypothetical protein